MDNEDDFCYGGPEILVEITQDEEILGRTTIDDFLNSQNFESKLLIKDAVVEWNGRAENIKNGVKATVVVVNK